MPPPCLYWPATNTVVLRPRNDDQQQSTRAGSDKTGEPTGREWAGDHYIEREHCLGKPPSFRGRHGTLARSKRH